MKYFKETTVNVFVKLIFSNIKSTDRHKAATSFTSKKSQTRLDKIVESTVQTINEDRGAQWHQNKRNVCYFAHSTKKMTDIMHKYYLHTVIQKKIMPGKKIVVVGRGRKMIGRWLNHIIFLFYSRHQPDFLTNSHFTRLARKWQMK